ncbi:MAG: hypothetical protein MAG431_01446 [Chloroflexi bacterium]|nr:hypothetical protein [Chloroflexota bacterium]
MAYGLYGAFAHVFYRAQAKANARFPLGVVFYDEVPTAIIDVRREDFYAHLATLRSVEGDFVGVALVDGQEGGHVLYGVVSFEISRLDGDNAIIGGVGFVETVAGKLLPIFEDGLGCFSVHAFFDSPSDEFFAVLFDFSFFFLGDGFA